MRRIKFLSGSIWNTLMLLVIIFMLPGTVAAIAGTERSLQEAYRSEIARAEQVTEASAESLKSQMKRAQNVLFYILESSGELVRMRVDRAADTDFQINSVKLAQSVKAMLRFSEENYDGVFFYFPEAVEYLIIGTTEESRMIREYLEGILAEDAFSNGWFEKEAEDGEWLIFQTHHNSICYGCWIDAVPLLQSLRRDLGAYCEVRMETFPESSAGNSVEQQKERGIKTVSVPLGRNHPAVTVDIDLAGAFRNVGSARLPVFAGMLAYAQRFSWEKG